MELDREQHHHQESLKDIRKHERRVKELTIQVEDDRKSQVFLKEQVTKYESRLKHYKRQVEETEEIANINLAKFRKVQTAYDDIAERAELAEATVKSNRMYRSTVSVGRVSSPVVSIFTTLITN